MCYTLSMEKIIKRTMPGTGDEVSILGFGCMRFKRNLAAIDQEKAEQQIRYAIEAGVNYLDTAYLYPGSEKTLGAILAKRDPEGVRLRDRVFLATKLPVMLVKDSADFERFLAASLERLGTDYIDYYLLHNLSGFKAWERGKKLGLPEFLKKAKADGKIGHVGFSWHGNLHDFRAMIDDYPWEFCQIQYNYLDENFQAGVEGLKYAAAKGVGLIVMEPLRGGSLAANLPPDAARIIGDHKDDSSRAHSPAYWALRWVWNHPEVALLLSGMNDIRQIEENLATARDALPDSLAQSELEMIGRVRDAFRRSNKIDCTGCAYCMPCPFGVNIPACFASWNEHAIFGGVGKKFSYNFNLRATGDRPSGLASACRKCGACERKCPQQLSIVKSLEETAKTLEGPFLRAVIRVVGKFAKG